MRTTTRPTRTPTGPVRTLHLVDVENLSGGPAGIERWFGAALEDDRLVVGSGDHAFGPLLAEVVARGRAAEVVARPRSLSHQLTGVGAAVHRLTDLPAVTAGPHHVLAA